MFYFNILFLAPFSASLLAHIFSDMFQIFALSWVIKRNNLKHLQCGSESICILLILCDIDSSNETQFRFFNGSTKSHCLKMVQDVCVLNAEWTGNFAKCHSLTFVVLLCLCFTLGTLRAHNYIERITSVMLK